VEGVHYLTNQNLFDLKALPGKLLVVGGGPIGIEMAQAFRRLGSEVTVIHSKAMILEKEAPEIASVLTKDCGPRASGSTWSGRHTPSPTQITW
jgi:pyruvate/2-oxoglutarate dehydrogenase complex dihydrolipoamide dehydrogenase (E3) component